MIYVEENKALLCKGDFHPAELYKGDKKIAGYTLTEFEGTGSVTLENCYNDKVYDVQIEGITDATITARGKNILDMTKHTVESGYYFDSSGVKSDTDERFVRIEPIKVVPNNKYRVSSNLDIYSLRFAKTNLNHSSVYISGERVNDSTKVFTTPDECYYVKISMHNTSGGADTSALKWAMIEKGTGDGIYEPYIEPQEIMLENGELAADIPTFKGTTVIEIEPEITATISGKYKKVEG